MRDEVEQVVPSGTSSSPGSSTRPMTVTSFVPRLASMPTEANASGECDMIQATCARVSAFWTTVGAPPGPLGGVGRPDERHAAVAAESALMSAVSSPAT